MPQRGKQDPGTDDDQPQEHVPKGRRTAARRIGKFHFQRPAGRANLATMPAKKTAPKNTPTPPVHVDAEAAQAAFHAVLPRIEALSEDAIVQVTVDLQDVAIKVLAVAAFLAEKEPTARFGLLHPEVFNPQHLADLKPFALAAAHAYDMLQSARAQSTEAKLPVQLADNAGKVKARMLKCADYHFEDDPVLGKEIQDIRIGTGYRDLASDLNRLAKLYDDQKAAIEHDKKHYRPGDAAEAKKLAATILRELGNAQSAEEQKWTGFNARVWTLLRTAYDEVQWAGQFLYRAASPEEKFPSLFAGGRRAKKPTELPTGGGSGSPTG